MVEVNGVSPTTRFHTFTIIFFKVKFLCVFANFYSYFGSYICSEVFGSIVSENLRRIGTSIKNILVSIKKKLPVSI
jgi:hypothetical protein